MDSVSGDKFIDDCARYIRYNENRLSQSKDTSLASATAWVNPMTWLRATSPPPASNRASRAPQLRPTPLRLTSHHLYYLLIRFEAIGIPTGPLDVQIPSTSRPSSYFAFISNNAAGSGYRQKDRDDTMSVSSLQTTMSALSNFGLGSTQNSSGWWGGKKADITVEIKYIYSAMTKIPALRIVPPPVKLIQDFEDCPGELSIPLDAFKNVQFLEFEDTDPRAFIGWDRLSSQLRSLSIKRSSVEDITDIIVDAVTLDAKRRKGERVRHRTRKVHAPDAQQQGEGEQTIDDRSSHQLQSQLPSLSWHFLRHLSLSDNSLTFLPSSCLSVLAGLTSLDLSNNLLNAVPPSLSLLPVLQSLNLTNNLIDSVMGIPDALPSIQALNLSQNRLESLCGLERLPTLKRIDLRHNEIFEAGEVGRLAILPKIVEVYIAGNPLSDEVDDVRVDVFVEFAKEGNDLDTLKLDSEVIGYFERQRVRERLPNMDRLTTKGRETTPMVDEVLVRRDTAPKDRIDAEPLVKTVRHRSNHSNAAQKNDAARRNRRVVELPPDSSNDSIMQRIDSTASKTNRVEEVSDSDIVKRAALAGDNESAMGSTPTPAVERSKSPTENLTRNPGAAMTNVSTKDRNKADISNKGRVQIKGSEEVDAPGPRTRIGRKQFASSDTARHDAGDKVSQVAGEQNLRKKIEALKGEVGDDWLRLLARGESVYVPREDDEPRA